MRQDTIGKAPALGLEKIQPDRTTRAGEVSRVSADASATRRIRGYVAWFFVDTATARILMT